MVSTFGIIKNIVRQLISNPLYLIVFVVWVLVVIAEFEFIDNHPIDWLHKNVNHTSTSGAAVVKFNNWLQENLHKVTVCGGLFMNIYFSRDSRKIKLINWFLIAITIVSKLTLRPYLRAVIFIVGEFLFCAISSEEYKFYIVVIVGLLICFENEIERNISSSVIDKFNNITSHNST